MFFSRRINHFMKLVEKGNFQRAADALYITASALRHSMDEFESYCGEKLLVRDKKGIKLTVAGEIIHKNLLPAFEQTNIIVERLPLKVNNIKRTVNIMTDGLYCPELSFKLRNLAKVFNKETIITNSLRSSYEDLKENMCDLAICAFSESETPSAKDICKVPLSIEETGILIKTDLWDRYGNITTILKKEPILLQGSFFSHPLYYELKNKVKHQNLKCHFTGLPDFADILISVRNGAGMTMISENMIDSLVSDEEGLIFIPHPFPFSMKVDRSIYFKKSKFHEMNEIALWLKNHEQRP